MPAGMIARELWWTNQEFYLVDIIPPWFSMLIYHLGDEHWCPQIRGALSPHQHHHHHHHHLHQP
jgi:hypothetical protein